MTVARLLAVCVVAFAVMLSNLFASRVVRVGTSVTAFLLAAIGCGTGRTPATPSDVQGGSATTAKGPSKPAPSGAQRRAQIYAALVGSWEGTLEYKDYQPPHARVTLPTRLEIARTAEILELAFTYDDGPNKIVKSTDWFEMDAAGTTLTWADEKDWAKAPSFAVREIADEDSRVRFVVETLGNDDNEEATLRETFTVGPRDLRILKEVRARGHELSFRHAYTLTRR